MQATPKDKLSGASDRRKLMICGIVQSKYKKERDSLLFLVSHLGEGGKDAAWDGDGHRDTHTHTCQILLDQ